MRHLVTAALLGLAVIHLLPLVGVVGGERLRALYGLGELDAPLTLLLRHRAVFFGLLGGSCAWAAFAPAHQTPALVAALISTVAFLLLARGQTLNGALTRVVRVDQVAVVLSVVGLVARLVAAA